MKGGLPEWRYWLENMAANYERADYERDSIRAALDLIDDLHKLINDGGACCQCAVDKYGVEIETCELHKDLDELRNKMPA